MAAWEVYALAQADAAHQAASGKAFADFQLENNLAAANKTQTIQLAGIQQTYQNVRAGAASYSTGDYDQAGLAVESWTDPETGDTYTSTPHQNTVYQAGVKNAWKAGDALQSTARLTYVSSMNSVQQTAQASLAAASRVYQEALSAARQTESNTRVSLRADFANLQATTYLSEISGWQSTPATPWHAQAYTVAAAQVTFTAAQQTAQIARTQAENQAQHTYAINREAAWETLLNDRASLAAAEAITLQQGIENGDTWIDEGDGQGYWMPAETTDSWGNPIDRYTNVTVELPPGLTNGSATDPTAADGSLSIDPFNGQLSLGNTFGSYIGSSSNDVEGMEGSTSPYDLAQRASQTSRGDQFDINNPLGSLGSSQAQVNQTIPGGWGQQPINPLSTNWQGDVRNQQTNTTAGSQIQLAGFEAAGSTPVDTDSTPPEVANNELPMQHANGASGIGSGTRPLPATPGTAPLPVAPDNIPRPNVNPQPTANLSPQAQLNQQLQALAEQYRDGSDVAGFFNAVADYREFSELGNVTAFNASDYTADEISLFMQAAALMRQLAALPNGEPEPNNSPENDESRWEVLMDDGRAVSLRINNNTAPAALEYYDTNSHLWVPFFEHELLTFGDVLQVYMELGLSFIPGYGELQDYGIITNPDTGELNKYIARISLAIGIVLGLNLGNIIKKVKGFFGLKKAGGISPPAKPNKTPDTAVDNSTGSAKNGADDAAKFEAPKGTGGFHSFSALKRALGPAGEGRHWHHIVEQSKVGQFGAEAIHHADNVISIPAPIHHRITGFYNSIQDFTGGQSVRQWLNGQSFEFQREFGMDILRRFGAL